MSTMDEIDAFMLWLFVQSLKCDERDGHRHGTSWAGLVGVEEREVDRLHWHGGPAIRIGDRVYS